jgi:hypothetical protein
MPVHTRSQKSLSNEPCRLKNTTLTLPSGFKVTLSPDIKYEYTCGMYRYCIYLLNRHFVF